MAVLEWRLTDALRDAAVRPTIDYERIHCAADVVDRDVAQDLDRAQLGIDLDFAEVGAVREARVVERLVRDRHERLRRDMALVRTVSPCSNFPAALQSERPTGEQ